MPPRQWTIYLDPGDGAREVGRMSEHQDIGDGSTETQSVDVAPWGCALVRGLLGQKVSLRRMFGRYDETCTARVSFVSDTLPGGRAVAIVALVTPWIAVEHWRDVVTSAVRGRV